MLGVFESIGLCLSLISAGYMLRVLQTVEEEEVDE